MARLSILIMPVVTLAILVIADVARPATYVYVSNAEDGDTGCMRWRATAR